MNSRKRGKLNPYPQGWWAGRVTFPDGEQLSIIPTLTNDPVMYRRGLERTYAAATVEVWEVDDCGNPVKGAEEAARAAAQEAISQVRDKEERQPKEAERPSGMGQLFRP